MSVTLIHLASSFGWSSRVIFLVVLVCSDCWPDRLPGLTLVFSWMTPCSLSFVKLYPLDVTWFCPWCESGRVCRFCVLRTDKRHVGVSLQGNMYQWWSQLFLKEVQFWTSSANWFLRTNSPDQSTALHKRFNCNSSARQVHYHEGFISMASAVFSAYLSVIWCAVSRADICGV